MRSVRSARSLVILVLIVGLSAGTARPASAEPLFCLVEDLAFRATITGSGLIQGTDGPDVIAGSNTHKFEVLSK